MAAAYNVDGKADLNTKMGEVDTSGVAPPPYHWEQSRSQAAGSPSNPAPYPPFSSPPMANNDYAQQYSASGQYAASAGVGQQYIVSHVPPPVGPHTPSSHVTGLVPEANKNWHQSFCGCFDNFIICLVTFFCSPVTECCIAYYLGRIKSFLAVFIILTIASTLCTVFGPLGLLSLELVASFVWLIACSVLIILLIVYRIRIRRDYGIAGTEVEDVCYICFCRQCALCQMMVQIDHEYVVSGKRTFFSRV